MKEEKEKFYVISVISNPVRYKSRYALYNKFCHHAEHSQVQHVTVEVVQGNRPFEITDQHHPFHIQLRTTHELWIKENMINIALASLPPDWKYVAWIDADVEFIRKDWAEETIQQLQHYKVVQMFQHAIDLGPSGETIHLHKGYVYSYQSKLPSGLKYETWHPGFAWAATREAIDGMGGLIDFAILGSGDRHMAAGLIGKMPTSYSDELHPHYKTLLNAWQKHALVTVKKNIGYVPGTIVHHWHGKKKNRQYKERWKVLVEHQYSPINDIKKDWQGLWQLHEDRIALRDDIRRYFRSRHEDSIDVE